MSESRTRDILESWRTITSAAELPKEPPRPRRANSFGFAGIAFAAIVVVAFALRNQSTVPAGSTSSSSPSGSTANVTQTVAPASTIPTQRASMSPSYPPLPAAGGTCSAGQFVLGTATSGPAYGPIGTTVMYATQPLRNRGASCQLVLPKTVGVVSATGRFVAIDVAETGTLTSHIGAGQSLSLILSARWPSGGTLASGATPPCHDPVEDVNRVVIPLASGTIQIDLNPTWHEVCPGPASVSLALTN